MTNKITSKIAVLALMMVLTITISPFTATAATTYYTYNSSQDYSQLRATLIAQIYALIAAIQAQDANQYYTYYNLNGQVLGVDTGFNISSVGVQTYEPSLITPDSAIVSGEVGASNASYSRVWFEYGKNTNLNNRSNIGRIDRYSSNSFRADLNNLDSGTRYYYRAVAEDSAGNKTYGRTLSFATTGSDNYYSNYSEPDLETDRAYNISSYRVSLAGSVDMNDFNKGRVFFVYGEDRNEVRNITDNYDRYRDIRNESDDMRTILVDSGLSNDRSYTAYASGLRRDTDHYFSICVEFEDDDNDSKIACGDMERFTTDRY